MNPLRKLRTIALPARIVEESAEVSCNDGVVTVILRKAEPAPPVD